MTKMSTSDLTARINRFLDRKMSVSGTVSGLSENKVRRSPRTLMDVSTAPYIQLAIK
ncbi:MAG: hypothetical protein WBK76_00295 [Candidatus Saccharimonadales bacterium]